MKHRSFTNFAQQYARARAGRGTYVTFGGNTAFVSGRRVNLPALPPGTVLSGWQIDVYNGYLDHEIGHLLYTDWFPDGVADHTPLIQMFWNLVEDIRIENRSILEYPSTKIYLDATTQQLEYDKRAIEEEKEKPTVETVAVLCLSLLYKEMYAVHRNADVIFEEKRNLADFPEFDALRQEMLRIPRLKSSKESYSLAQDLAKLFPEDKDFNAPALELAPNDKGQFFLPIFVVMGDGPSAGQVMPLQALNDAIQIFIDQHDRAKAIHNVIEDIADDNGLNYDPNKKNRRKGEPIPWSGERVLPPCGTYLDKIFVPQEADLPSYHYLRSSVQGEISAVKRMLQIYLQTRTKTSWEKGLQEGQLDTEQLSQLYSGNTALFKERRSTRAIDTACQMMVDLSGSMNEQMVQTATVLMAESLNGVPSIKSSIAGFTTISGDYDPVVGCGRMSPLYIPLFKDFEEPFSTACGRLGSLGTSGWTPLGDAYAQGFDRLIMRKERRRILWIVTDGDPELSIADHRHDEFMLMRSVYLRCKKHQIEVVSMNIGDMHPRTKEVCDISFFVEVPNQLPAAMLSALKAIAK
jgi:hypothetical protein